MKRSSEKAMWAKKGKGSAVHSTDVSNSKLLLKKSEINKINRLALEAHEKSTIQHSKFDKLYDYQTSLLKKRGLNPNKYEFTHPPRTIYKK